jgi:DNA-binding transcriptional regulator YdaS (Cro superfamily)
MTQSQQQFLKQFWQSMSPEDRETVAAKAGTTTEYLRQVLACGRRCGASLAKNIESATDGTVSRKVLRPDIFADMVHAA